MRQCQEIKNCLLLTAMPWCIGLARFNNQQFYDKIKL